MKVKKLTPKNIVLGLRQVFFTFSQIVRLVWKANPNLIVAVFIVNILSGLLIFPTFWLEKLTIDALVENIGNPLWQEAIKVVVWLFFFRITIGVIQSGLMRISGFLQFAVARVFSAHLEILIARKISELDMETIDNPDFKDRFNKVERESGRRAWGLAWPLSNIPNYFFGLLSTFSLIFFFKPLLALAIFFLAIPEFFIDARYTKLEYQFETKVSPKYRLWGWMTWYLTPAKNLLETKILKLPPYFLKRLKEIQEEIFTEGLRIRRSRETAHFLAYLPQNILIFFLSVYLGLLVIWKKITVGSAEMYLRATYSFQHNLTGLVGSFLELYESYLFITDLVWFLNLKPTISSGKKNFPSEIKKGVEFHNVWFRYKENQPWVLRGINLFIPRNTSLAIVGENGAGKTTLIKLLCRFYDPQKGEILIDGVNLKEFSRSELWENLAVLFQDFERYPFTARESIGYGRIEKLTRVDLISQFAKKSAIHDYITSLPLKYENPLAVDFEKGVAPSWGQWQRIGLSRVLFRGAKIIILDEPTSNVDAKAEEEIFKKISQLAKGKILVLISHRFSTVRRADKIVVLDKGKIAEEGTHRELMKKKGMYAQLFELQARSYR
ncbi:MAG: ABC transporter ATP-binding protein [Microgenomates group bacterium]